MQAFNFDSLDYMQELEKGGLSREHAETIARANARAFQAMLEARNLATREDLKLELARLEKDLKLELARLELNILGTKDSLIKWMCGIMLAGLAVGLGGLSILVAILHNIF